jgi:hypothetical protein
MELPDWLVDGILSRAQPVEVRLLLTVFRHGSPQVGGAGERRVYLRASMNDLHRIAGASKPHVIEAERTLVPDRDAQSVIRWAPNVRSHSAGGLVCAPGQFVTSLAADLLEEANSRG